MAVHLYLSLIPESLVASMLPPREFGAYLATGTRKRPHGQAIFFHLRGDFQSDYFDLAQAEKRCVPHDDGRPKHSLYLAIYRVLEHVPLEAIGSLWLTTAHGRSLELKQAPVPSGFPGRYHLYQEICPVHPLIASTLGPDEFRATVTDPSRAISVPKICFLELQLGGLATDPRDGEPGGVPFHDIDHLRNCLLELRQDAGKPNKTVDRVWHQGFLYRCVKNGFFVGDRQRMLYYPYPTLQELEGEYYSWWRCANDAELVRAGVGA